MMQNSSVDLVSSVSNCNSHGSGWPSYNNVIDAAIVYITRIFLNIKGKAAWSLQPSTVDFVVSSRLHCRQSALRQSFFPSMSALAYSEVAVSEPEFTVINPGQTTAAVLNISWSNVNFYVGTKGILTDCWGNVSFYLLEKPALICQ